MNVQNTENKNIFFSGLTVSPISACSSQRSYHMFYINVRSLIMTKRGNKTPKKGFKSITVKAEVYDYFFNEWLKVKEEYAINKGIHSFSAYVTYLLAQLIIEEKKRKGNSKLR